VFVISSKKTREKFTKVTAHVEIAEIREKPLNERGRELRDIRDVYPEHTFSAS